MTRLDLDQFAAVFDALDSGVVVLDGDQRVICWNYWFASASDRFPSRRWEERCRSCFPDTRSAA